MGKVSGHTAQAHQRPYRKQLCCRLCTPRNPEEGCDGDLEKAEAWAQPQQAQRAPGRQQGRKQGALAERAEEEQSRRTSQAFFVQGLKDPHLSSPLMTWRGPSTSLNPSQKFSRNLGLFM